MVNLLSSKSVHRELHTCLCISGYSTKKGIQSLHKARCCLHMKSTPPGKNSVPRHETSCRAAVLEFSKYQGLGNDFILVDNRQQEEPIISASQAAKLCDRNIGVGADGVIFALPPQNGNDYSMRIFNSDGSEPEMCGNGIRCLAKFIADRDNRLDVHHRVHTLAGQMKPQILENGQVRVDMGPPILDALKIPTELPPSQDRHAVQVPLENNGTVFLVTAVSMGNPHAVVFGTADGATIKLEDINIYALGPLFENHPAFPARTNTEFIEVLSTNHIKMAVWERGAGRTLACGTGACAAVVAGVLEGRVERKCRVDLPGGTLEIEWQQQNSHVYMTGPAELVYTGNVEMTC